MQILSGESTVKVTLNVFLVVRHILLVCAHVCVCVCVCVWVGGCGCMPVCVLILFHRKGFFRMQWCLGHTWVYGWMILYCEYFTRCFCQVPSSTLPNVSYFTSKNETLAIQQAGEKITWYMLPRKDDIYWYRIYVAQCLTDNLWKDTKDNNLNSNLNSSTLN